MSRVQIGAAMLAIATTAVLTAAATLPPAGNRSLRSFDADRIAELEVGMWQAYYAKQRLRLFGLLVLTLREQYHYSWATATTSAFHLARAAATFGDATGNYDRVLPDLTKAYRAVKDHSGADFRAEDLARAELAWWVARRVPGRNAPEQVGQLIAEEYSALYGAPLHDMVTAGRLRAEAAALRDRRARQPDWPTISRMLTESYRELAAELSVAPGNAR